MSTDYKCPFCLNGKIEPVDNTDPKRRLLGLIYLEARCPVCRNRIEAVGNGIDDAIEDFERRLAHRENTDPERWKTRPVPQRKKRKR